MRAILIQLVFQQPINQQRRVAYHEVSDDPPPGTMEHRPRPEIRFQDAEAVLYLVAVVAYVQYRPRVVDQIRRHGIIPVVLLLPVNGGLVDRKMVGGLFAALSNRIALDEPRDVMGPFFDVVC